MNTPQRARGQYTWRSCRARKSDSLFEDRPGAALRIPGLEFGAVNSDRYHPPNTTTTPGPSPNFVMRIVKLGRQCTARLCVDDRGNSAQRQCGEPPRQRVPSSQLEAHSGSFLLPDCASLNEKHVPVPLQLEGECVDIQWRCTNDTRRSRARLAEGYPQQHSGAATVS